MIKITREEVLKLAQISQIKVQEHEVDHLRSELEAVLTYASCLKDIAEKHEAVTAIPKNSNVMREDIVKLTDPVPLLNQAPEVENNYFVVPKIIKQS